MEECRLEGLVGNADGDVERAKRTQIVKVGWSRAVGKVMVDFVTARIATRQLRGSVLSDEQEEVSATGKATRAP